MSKHTVMAIYRVQGAKEDEFRELLAKHWPTLKRCDLVTDEPVRLYRGEEDGRPIYTEIFEWLPGASERAHQMPEVLAIWEPMASITEERGENLPGLSFPHVARVEF